MPITSIRRRVGRLEGVAMFVSVVDYPTLTSPEINAIACRVQMGKPLTADELARVTKQSPVVDGELLIRAHRGTVFIKRYGGIDLADI